jgi:hypothetical protein
MMTWIGFRADLGPWKLHDRPGLPLDAAVRLMCAWCRHARNNCDLHAAAISALGTANGGKFPALLDGGKDLASHYPEALLLHGYHQEPAAGEEHTAGVTVQLYTAAHNHNAAVARPHPGGYLRIYRRLFRSSSRSTLAPVSVSAGFSLDLLPEKTRFWQQNGQVYGTWDFGSGGPPPGHTASLDNPPPGRNTP